MLIADGEILERNLRSQRITHQELAAEARQSQIAALSDVAFAVLESSGKISFLTSSSSGSR